jgi:pre-mRNA-splicing factor ISY1
MARNSEKAKSMLYRFREAQYIEMGIASSSVRPKTASVVMKLPEAEKWRAEIVRDISNKVSRIQDGIPFNIVFKL